MPGEIIGNVVTPEKAFFGAVTVEGKHIAAVEERGTFKAGENWVLPGFIDLHLHGLGNGEASSAEEIRKMMEFAPSTGLTGFLPTCSARPMEELLKFADGINRAMASPVGGKVLGAHFEGPYIEAKHKGGMLLPNLHTPSLSELDELLDALQGHLRLMTLSPELEGTDALIQRLREAGVTVSAGHTGCSPERLKEAADLGVTHVCHLFDTFDGRVVKCGVTQVSLADAAMLDDRLNIEVIVDGCHVPPGLIEITRRVVGPHRFIAVTDGLKGAGLPDGIYGSSEDGLYTLSATDACRRLKDNAIIGSCLSMNRAFFNLTTRFGFTPVEAALATSTNAARAIGLNDSLGSLEAGKIADIAVVSPVDAKVRLCLVDGREEYVSHE